MPQLEFSKIKDNEDFPMVPPGCYHVEVVAIDDTLLTKKTGEEMWSIKLKVLEGDEQGSLISDLLVFTDKALPRVKLVCSRLGIDVTQKGFVDVNRAMLMGQTCWVNVEHKEYDGKTRATIPFDGYLAERVDTGGGSLASADVPF